MKPISAMSKDEIKIEINAYKGYKYKVIATRRIYKDRDNFIDTQAYGYIKDKCLATVPDWLETDNAILLFEEYPGTGQIKKQIINIYETIYICELGNFIGMGNSISLAICRAYISWKRNG